MLELRPVTTPLIVLVGACAWATPTVAGATSRGMHKHQFKVEEEKPERARPLPYTRCF